MSFLTKLVILGVASSTLGLSNIGNVMSFDFMPKGGTSVAGDMEVAFSPNGGATELVVKTINNAKQSIKVAAYSFTSKPIAHALLSAKRRGVDVKVVMDEESNRKYTAGTYLANQGVEVRIDGHETIHHNKFIVVDGKTVELGSFNYSDAAEKKNAENVLVVHNNPQLAQKYETNWEVHWGHATPMSANY